MSQRSRRVTASPKTRARHTCQYHSDPVQVAGCGQSGVRGRRRRLRARRPVADHADDVQPARARIGPQERAARVRLARTRRPREVRAQLLLPLGIVSVLLRRHRAVGRRRDLHVRLVQ